MTDEIDYSRLSPQTIAEMEAGKKAAAVNAATFAAAEKARAEEAAAKQAASEVNMAAEADAAVAEAVAHLSPEKQQEVFPVAKGDQRYNPPSQQRRNR